MPTTRINYEEAIARAELAVKEAKAAAAAQKETTGTGTSAAFVRVQNAVFRVDLLRDAQRATTFQSSVED
jgi:hypothetical protein